MRLNRRKGVIDLCFCKGGIAGEGVGCIASGHMRALSVHLRFLRESSFGVRTLLPVADGYFIIITRTRMRRTEEAVGRLRWHVCAECVGNPKYHYFSIIG